MFVKIETLAKFQLIQTTFFTGIKVVRIRPSPNELKFWEFSQNKKSKSYSNLFYRTLCPPSSKSICYDVLKIFSYDSLKIYDGETSDSLILGSYCGTSIPPSHISSGNEIFIHFHTDTWQTRQGFKMEYHATSKLNFITFELF